jgi:hypothetical protein
MTEKELDKQILMQQLDFRLRLMEELQATDKQRLSIVKHIAKMPKKARIEFINALMLLKHKSENYDEFAMNDTGCSMEWEGEDYDPLEDREEIIDTVSDWNK